MKQMVLESLLIAYDFHLVFRSLLDVINDLHASSNGNRSYNNIYFSTYLDLLASINGRVVYYQNMRKIMRN